MFLNVNGSSNIFLPCLNRLSWASWSMHTNLRPHCPERWILGSWRKSRAKPWSWHQSWAIVGHRGRWDRHMARFCSHLFLKCLHQWTTLILDFPPQDFLPDPSPLGAHVSETTWVKDGMASWSGSSSPLTSGPEGPWSLQLLCEPRAEKGSRGAAKSATGGSLWGEEGLIWCLANQLRGERRRPICLWVKNGHSEVELKKMEKIPVWVLQPKGLQLKRTGKETSTLLFPTKYWLKHGNFLKDRIHFLHPWRFPVLGWWGNSLGVLWKVLLFSWKAILQDALYTLGAASQEVQRKGYDSQGHTGRLALTASG